MSDDSDPVAIVALFERRYGGQSLALACHAAAAHRLRPELVALIRTNFLRGPARLDPLHDADLLFGPLCRDQGGGFFEMPPDVRHHLLRLLDAEQLRPGNTDFPSRRVAHFLRHYFAHVREADPRYTQPRYRRYMHENMWRALALDDPELAQRHIFDHAEARNAVTWQQLGRAPRGGGIVAVAGPVLATLRDEMAYLAAQDLIADGYSDMALTVLGGIDGSALQFGNRTLAAPQRLVDDIRQFRQRRENTVVSSQPADQGADGPGKVAHGLDVALQIDASKLMLADNELHAAVGTDDEAAVAKVLDARLELIDTLDSRGWAALHRSTRSRSTAISRLLLERGATVDRPAALLHTPLYCAAEWGATAIAKLLLDAGADPSAPTADKSTPLMTASYHGHREMVELLLAAMGPNLAAIDATNDRGMSALQAAVELGSLALFDRLIAAGARVPVPSSGQWTLLHSAARSGNAALVARLIAEGYPVDGPDADGWTPLLVAGQTNTGREAVELLLECGADPVRPQVYGWAPAQIASHWNQRAVLGALVEFGVSMGAPNGSGRSTYLGAAAAGAADTLAFLLDADGVLPKEVDVRGQSAAALAVASGNTAAVEVLLNSPKMGADSATALLEQAVRQKKPDIIRFLLGSDRVPPVPRRPDESWVWTAFDLAEERDATLAALIACPSIDLPDRNGRALVVDVAEAGLTASMDALIGRGVGLDVADTTLETPLGAGVRAGELEIVEKLLSAGADPDLPSKGTPPILAASGAILLALLAHRASVDALLPDGRNALHLLAASEDTSTGAAELNALMAAGLSTADVDSSGRTPLHVAAEAGRLTKLARLLARGAEVEAVNLYGQTPLLSAIAAGQAGTADALLDKGANPGAHLPGGWSALHLAVERGLMELVERLWPLSVDPTAPAADPPRNVLQVAAEAGLPEMAELLLRLRFGADMAAPNSPTPLVLALQGSGFKVAELLLEAGASVRAVDPGSGKAVHEIASDRFRRLLQTNRLTAEDRAVLERIIGHRD
ncbi:ankyrin repeat domain-containing protein [Devosia sp. SD17-2]|uniref:ankyrin repeat domain-containing protein n=1 Tax=Devosia sp. SD17-2 TaxID=2976459 RepID=UPI0023D8B908|nr:ankyrin repeat domain-containing protein [Devosia sp. SD17-2]WEJ31696.1 ankyrin repeat domain-containing protein [Devosia sp. SD17-2]